MSCDHTFKRNTGLDQPLNHESVLRLRVSFSCTKCRYWKRFWKHKGTAICYVYDQHKKYGYVPYIPELEEDSK